MLDFKPELEEGGGRKQWLGKQSWERVGSVGLPPAF